MSSEKHYQMILKLQMYFYSNLKTKTFPLSLVIKILDKMFNFNT